MMGGRRIDVLPGWSATVLMIAACGPSRTPGRPTPEAWTTAAHVAVTRGPEGAPGPTNLLWEWQEAVTPAGEVTGVGVSPELHRVIDSLEALQGKAIAAARRASRFAGDSSMLALNPLTQLEVVARHPMIRGPLIRRSFNRRGWSATAHQAAATLAAAEGSVVENTVLPSEMSLILAGLLQRAGAIDAVIVDPSGVVLAATSAGFLPSLHKLAAWPTVAQATGEHILVGPVLNEPGWGLPVRRVAVPIHSPGENTVIGWLLAKVLAPPPGSP